MLITIRLPHHLGPIARSLFALVLVQLGFVPVMEPPPGWDDR